MSPTAENNETLPQLVPRNPVIWIDAPGRVESASGKISLCKVIGLDVETTLESPPALCTVQIATREKNYIFDALALRDRLGPVYRILEDPEVVKVIHYARFEKGVMSGEGWVIENIFDTYLVSRKLRGRMTRYDHSLAAVCRRELGCYLDKSCQKSDWARRPLSSGQIRYAALDAELMLLLYDIFQGEIMS